MLFALTMMTGMAGKSLPRGLFAQALDLGIAMIRFARLAALAAPIDADPAKLAEAPGATASGLSPPATVPLPNADALSLEATAFAPLAMLS